MKYQTTVTVARLTLTVRLGSNSSFANYGTVHSSDGIYVPTASLPSISGVREDNYGLIYTKGGPGIEGNGIMNNFSTGDLENGSNGSMESRCMRAPRLRLPRRRTGASSTIK